MIRLKPWSSIGKEEEAAVLRVVRSGTLSGFLGGELDGGQEVQALEQEWSELNGGGYSVAVNSATSGILIALKAVGVGPGSKVICSPYSMSAGVACVRWLGARPVFADIDDDYCLDQLEVIRALDENDDAAAILTTNLFGGMADDFVGTSWPVPVIEDNAQAPLTHNFYGTIAVDSFNCHKPIQAGEGGMCTTNDPDLATQLKLLRNHGELDRVKDIYPGLNLRMTEITAAIARAQIAKGREIIRYRRRLARLLTDGLQGIKDLHIRPFDPSNAYYVFPIRVRADIRDRMVGDLQEHGIPVRAGYGGGPLYHLPAFHEYARSCPNCELIDKELIILEMYAHAFDEEIIDQVIEAFQEVAYEAAS